MKVRLTKQFHFEMAHALYGHDGPCRNIHGHSYSLEVCVLGEPANERNHPKNGMVVDFSELKKIVTAAIVSKVDHALVLNGGTPHSELAGLEDHFEKIIYVPFQPTCENLLIDFVQALKLIIGDRFKLQRVLLRETPSSYAEWFADDNA